MASLEDNVTTGDIYAIDQGNQDINHVLPNRIDPSYSSYINVTPMTSIQPNAPNFPTNTNYTSTQSFQSIYPRLQVQSETTEDEPIYVNAKQYNRIILRRKARAKWEAEHRVTKKEKPYMHQSRHEHAMRRIRGPDGRFLKKDEIEAMIKRGELKLNTSDNQTQSQPQPVNPLVTSAMPMQTMQSIQSMQFPGLPMSVVDPRMPLMSTPMPIDQNPEITNVGDKVFQTYYTEGQEAAL